jgi:ketosteroid isomerase-like protein
VTNAEILQRFWAEAPEIWNEAAVGWWREHAWAPDIQWRAIEGAPDDVGPMSGRARLTRYYAEWIEMFDEIRTELRDVGDVGDKVVAELHVTAKSRSTGMPLELDYAILYELDAEGRIAAGTEYATSEAAEQAARAGAEAGRVSEG